MKDQWSVWHGGVDFLQAVEVEFDFSFVKSVSSPNRNRKSVHVRFTNKPSGIVCFSQKLCRGCGGIIVLSNVAQLAFNRHASRMCELNHAPRQHTIISER